MIWRELTYFFDFICRQQVIIATQIYNTNGPRIDFIDLFRCRQDTANPALVEKVSLVFRRGITKCALLYQGLDLLIGFTALALLLALEFNRLFLLQAFFLASNPVGLIKGDLGVACFWLCRPGRVFVVLFWLRLGFLRSKTEGQQLIFKTVTHVASFNVQTRRFGRAGNRSAARTFGTQVQINKIEPKQTLAAQLSSSTYLYWARC